MPHLAAALRSSAGALLIFSGSQQTVFTWGRRQQFRVCQKAEYSPDTRWKMESKSGNFVYFSKGIFEFKAGMAVPVDYKGQVDWRKSAWDSYKPSKANSGLLMDRKNIRLRLWGISMVEAYWCWTFQTVWANFQQISCSEPTGKNSVSALSRFHADRRNNNMNASWRWEYVNPCCTTQTSGSGKKKHQ